jgi:dipeptidyl aminopeptidase/acylaminoacyl peptidase
VIDGKPSSAGVDNPTRADIPYVMYLLDGKARVIRRLNVAINDKAVPTWSPDGRWLAYRTDGKYPLGRAWLLDMRTANAKPRMLLERPALGSIAWLPDSKRLIVTAGDFSPAVPYGFYVLRAT